MTASVIEPGLLRRLGPICRSITGPGVRETLSIVAELIAVQTVAVPSGRPVLDWTVPQEWTCRGAYVAAADGERVIDMAASALHLVSYSEPVRAQLSFDELRPHLHTLADHPDWIPYRTAYWNRTWGFCLRHRDLDALAGRGPFDVVVDTELSDGVLNYGELTVEGSSERELLVSTHICHPTMVNDNVSGIVGAIELARRLAASPLRHRVRFLFLPGTIGAICWLAQNRELVANVSGGLVLTGLGDAAPLTYKASRRETSRFDRTARRVIRRRDDHARTLDWSPYGYDERQFCAPAFDLAVGRLTRGVHGTYPEYHSSADDASFVSCERIESAVDAAEEILRSFDAAPLVRSLAPEGEPQLGRRGLYRPVAGDMDSRSVELAYLWVLSLADGDHTTDDIEERSGLDPLVVRSAVERLVDAGLCVSSTLC